MAASEPPPLPAKLAPPPPPAPPPAPAAAPPRRSAAAQAAACCLLAPAVAVLMGVYAGHADRLTARALDRAIPWILYAGLGLGVAALLAVPWAGRRRVLGRAAIGLALTAATLWATGRVQAANAAADVRHGPTGPDPKWVVGQWGRRYRNNGSELHEVLTLNADGTYHQFIRTTYGLVLGDWSGTWRLDADQLVEQTRQADVNVGVRSGDHDCAIGTVRVGTWQLLMVPAEGPARLLRYARVPDVAGSYDANLPGT